MARVKEIFRRARDGVSLFKDRAVLSPDYIPASLPFRDDQIDEVAEKLEPILEGAKPSNLLLYGKTGTGKTAVARYVLEELQAEAGKRRIVVAYVNTRIADTEYRALAEFSEFLGLSEDEHIPFTGLATAEVIKRIFNQIKSKAIQVVLVMDEIDHLVKRSEGAGVLYQLTRSNERLSPGSLSLVGISNDLKFKEGLDPRILSSLSEEEMVFPPYNVDELRQILTERAKMAFKPSTVSPSAINLCAAMAGSEHGDARRAIDLLRIAGEVAERESLAKVDESCIRKASDKIEHDKVDEALRTLPIHDKLILLTISRFKAGTNTGELYVAYTNTCKKSGVEALTQRRMSGILAELDLMGLVEASVVSSGRRGRTKKIQLLISDETLAKTLSEDPMFGAAR